MVSAGGGICEQQRARLQGSAGGESEPGDQALRFLVSETREQGGNREKRKAERARQGGETEDDEVKRFGKKCFGS